MNANQLATPLGGRGAAGASTRWLQWACWATLLFGAALLLAPWAARGGFSLLIFGDAAVIDSWPAQARGYVTLLHGVLGAVMVGWAVALLRLARAALPLAQVRRAVGLSIAAWYLPDTLFSLLVGAWPNAAFNSVLAALFAAALWMARPRS